MSRSLFKPRTRPSTTKISQKAWAEGKDLLPQPIGSAFPKVGQVAFDGVYLKVWRAMYNSLSSMLFDRI